MKNSYRACEQCGAILKPIWLKNGICNGCQNPQLIVTAKVSHIFTAKINKLSQTYPSFIEYEVYLNDSIFCHLCESDFEIFAKVCRDGGHIVLV